MYRRFMLFSVVLTLILTACAGAGGPVAGTPTPEEGLPTAAVPSPIATTEPTPMNVVPAVPSMEVSQPVDAFATQDPNMPANPDRPWEPAAGDAKFMKGNVFLDGADVLTMESAPPQFMLTLDGSLPTPCHQLRVVVGQPDAENRIQVEVYSVVDPDMICTQVLHPFTQNIPMGSYPAGQYTVWINGEKIADIQS